MNEEWHIIGAGGLGKDLVACFGRIIQIAGFWDDGAIKGSLFNGLPVLGDVEALLQLNRPVSLAIAVGNPLVRRKLFNTLKVSHHRFPNLIHPEARLFNSEKIIFGTGSIVFPGVFMTTDIILGDNVLLHIGCSVHHDVEIGNHSVLMPGARVTGNALVGSEVLVASNATITNGMKIPDGSRHG